MSEALTDPVEMIRLGAPRIIRNDVELEAYTEALFQLTAKKNTTPEEDEAIDLLSLLVTNYEEKHYPVPKASSVDVLRFLMEHNGLTQKDLVPQFGAISTVSLVLTGKRQMTREHIARLSARFGISPEAFFGDEEAAHPRKTRATKGKSGSKATAA